VKREKWLETEVPNKQAFKTGAPQTGPEKTAAEWNGEKSRAVDQNVMHQ